MTPTPDKRIRLRADLYARLRALGHGSIQAGIGHLLDVHNGLAQHQAQQQAQLDSFDRHLCEHIERQMKEADQTRHDIKHLKDLIGERNRAVGWLVLLFGFNALLMALQAIVFWLRS